MILSRTGFGKAEYNFSDHKTIVEIRSLNSKQLDLTLKVMPHFHDKESEIRRILSAELERGKVDVAVYIQQSETDSQPSAINWAAAETYAAQYKAHFGDVPPEVMASIMRFPDVLRQTVDSGLSDEEWVLLQTAIQQAINAFNAFRQQEGAALEKMFTEKLDGISALLAEVEPFEKNRVENIRQSLVKNLDKLAEETKQKVDMNRLEAELIYYLEKLDITEEKVRLTNHIRYFREVMANGERTNGESGGVGKKLGFIAQEMGREINTLGSKSNQSEMQIIVVKMKDLLEQIKEQVLNVL